MLRHFPHAARALAVAFVVALAAAGCGIKGPLVPPPKPDPAKSQDREAPEKRSP